MNTPNDFDLPRQRPGLLRRNPPNAPSLEPRRRHGGRATAVAAMQVAAAQRVRPYPHEKPGRQQRLFPDVTIQSTQFFIRSPRGTRRMGEWGQRAGGREGGGRVVMVVSLLLAACCLPKKDVSMPSMD